MKLEKKGEKTNFVKAKKVIGRILRKQGIKINNKYWPLLLNFAQRKGVIDYKFLLDIYKGRMKRLNV